MTRSHAGRLPGVAAALGLMVACAASPEEQVLTRFFDASRSLDSTLLNRWSTVTFNPRTEGSIQRFTIVERGPEQRAPLIDAQREEALRSLAASSTEDADLSGSSVEIVTRQVKIDAAVRTPDGAVKPGMLLVTLERAIARRQQAVVEGGWIVTRLQRAPDARTSRAASSAPQN
jgi:hypothetical protein